MLMLRERIRRRLYRGRQANAAAIQLADVGVAIGPRATNAAKGAADGPLGPLGWEIGASAAVGSSLAAPLVQRLLDEVQGPATASAPTRSVAAADAVTAG